MNTLVFSDVHLNVAADGREAMERFTRFLRWIDPASFPRIVIAGDLFDFWYEYRSAIFSGYFEVLRALADLRDGGAEFHFAVGNHDFWAGRFLRDELGFRIYDGPFTLDFGGLRTRIVHGDGINPADRSYRLYKRFARWRPVVGAFRLIHPDWAMGIAQGVSRGSRHMFQTEELSAGSEVAPQRTYAERTLGSGEADAVICGHTHYPVLERLAGGIYVNAGDWLYHRTYVTWSEGRFRRWGYSADAEHVLEAEIVAEGE